MKIAEISQSIVDLFDNALALGAKFPVWFLIYVVLALIFTAMLLLVDEGKLKKMVNTGMGKVIIILLIVFLPIISYVMISGTILVSTFDTLLRSDFEPPLTERPQCPKN